MSGQKSLLSYSVSYFSEIFIDLIWYDYIIDKPYAVVNQNNLTFNCHSILECCVMFSGVKFSIRSFNLFL